MNDSNQKESQFQKLSNIKEDAKNNRRSKWLMRIVVIFLVLVFLSGIAWGANDLVSREGSELPPYALAEITERNAVIETTAPKTAAQMLELIGEATDYAKQEKPKLRLSRSFDIEQDSIRFYDANTQNELDAGTAGRLTAAATLMRSALEEQLGSGYENRETQFGESMQDLLWEPDIQEEDLAQKADCTYQNYICTAYDCGHTQEEPPQECPSCGAENTYELQYLNDYTILLPFTDDSVQVTEIFQPPTTQQLADLLSGSLGEFIVLENVTVTSVYDAVFSCVVQRAQTEDEHGKLKSMKYDCAIDVEITLRFTDELAEVGSVVAAVTLHNSASFDLTWPSIVLKETEYSLEKRGGVTLKATQVAPEGTAFFWKSSDESAVTVDAQGNVSAGKTLGASAEIIVYMELNGVIYQDACTVTVKNSVEKIKLSRNNLTLQQGGSAQLIASVSPRDATFKEVYWFSRDDGIVTVDQNGTVTALAPGVVEICALTVDGNMKSTCTITVEGEA